MSSIPVARCMSREPVTVAPETDVAQAIQLMLAHHIGALPVLEEGRLVGILTERDILAWAARLL